MIKGLANKNEEYQGQPFLKTLHQRSTVNKELLIEGMTASFRTLLVNCCIKEKVVMGSAPGSE